MPVARARAHMKMQRRRLRAHGFTYFSVSDFENVCFVNTDKGPRGQP